MNDGKADVKAGIEDGSHERVRRLIDKERVEGLAAPERRLLEEHLAACEACAGRAATTDAALRALRTMPVSVPRGLAASAKLTMRRRAEELRVQHRRNFALAVSCTLSWLVGVASAPLVWHACAWLGAMFDLPRVVWVLGFGFWWLVPAVAAGGVVLWYRSRAERESS